MHNTTHNLWEKLLCARLEIDSSMLYPGVTVSHTYRFYAAKHQTEAKN